MTVIKNYQAYVFDLDNTLYLDAREKEYEKSVKTYLSLLKQKGKKLFIATHNKSPEYRLKALDIMELFDEIIIEKKDVHPWIHSISDFTNKADMIRDIMNKYSLTKDDILFFDDAPYNIIQVSKINVDSVLVDPRTGVNFRQDL